MLNIKGISAYYDNICAINNVSVTVNNGEIVAVIGANGAGKTTLLMAISGIVPITSGSIVFQEEEIHHASADFIVKRGISHVPEGRRIFPQMTVQENLDLGAHLRRDQLEIQKDLDYIYELFPVLKERRKRMGGTLSGGEQQMLAVSRALMTRPQLLLLDEPSLGLAPIFVQKIFGILRYLNEEQNTTILLVEQNANMALNLASRGYVMETGLVKLSDDAKKLMVNPTVQELYLGV